MVAKQLSINSILAFVYEIYLVMPAPPQFPDVIAHLLLLSPRVIVNVYLPNLRAQLTLTFW